MNTPAVTNVHTDIPMIVSGLVPAHEGQVGVLDMFNVPAEGAPHVICSLVVVDDMLEDPVTPGSPI
jgi:hypothetical protein